MKVCKDCQRTFSQVSEHDKFCGTCGEPFTVIPDKCDCGRKLTRFHVYCPRCGKATGIPEGREE